jgi:single-stranded DNA-binding protein
MQREEMWQNVWSAVKKNALPYLVKGAAAGVGGRIAYDIYKGTK